MIICKICGTESKSIQRGFAQHLVIAHDISVLEYFVKYEEFEIPLCECGDNRKHRCGLTFRQTCEKAECRRKNACRAQSACKTEEVRAKLRNARLKYMKENPQNTAWRLGNKQSWPEKFFQEALERQKLNNRFLIVREFAIHPYYIDFAFVQLKIAVEIDGAQHEQPDRKHKDDIRDDHLMKLGWRVYRIPANKLYSQQDADSVIVDFVDFLNCTDNFKECGIMSSAELKRALVIKNEEEKAKRKAELKRFIIDQIDNVDNWTETVGLALGIGSPRVRKHIRRFYPDVVMPRSKRKRC